MSEDKKAPETGLSTDVSMSQRFTDKVIAEFAVSSGGDLDVSPYQKSLIQGYFIAIDKQLKNAEAERLRKNATYSKPEFKNELGFTWANIDLECLARDVMINAKQGLDIQLPNHIHAVPYKNKQDKYVLNLRPGYQGKRILAEKYGVTKPKAITIELVCKNDTFIPLKKGLNQVCDSYKFEISNPFDRGDIIGGFGYIEFDDPTKNELHIITLGEIEKRKPEKAAPEFWGGEKDEYKNGKKTGEKVKVEGWFKEMAYKTVARFVYDKIPLDSQRMAEYNNYISSREAELAEMEVTAEIEERANMENLDISDADFQEIPKETDPNSPAPPAAGTPIESPVEAAKPGWM